MMSIIAQIGYNYLKKLIIKIYYFYGMELAVDNEQSSAMMRKIKNDNFIINRRMP